MSVTEIIQAAQFITISGQEVVILERSVWQEIMDWLEDLEDAEELRQARQEEDETIPWEQVKAELSEERLWDEAFASSQDPLAALADEAAVERLAGRVELLIPDTL